MNTEEYLKLEKQIEQIIFKIDNLSHQVTALTNDVGSSSNHGAKLSEQMDFIKSTVKEIANDIGKSQDQTISRRVDNLASAIEHLKQKTIYT